MRVRKRNGIITDFDESKIRTAVTRAIVASKPKGYDKGILQSEFKGVAPLIAANITAHVKNSSDVVSIEEIHNKVEEELMKLAYYDAAKVYILYREKKRERRVKEREEKRKLLNIEGELDPVSEKFSLNALRVIESRYLIKDENLKPIETPTELFERIATHVGCANILYDESIFNKDGKNNITDVETDNANQFYGVINQKFVPKNPEEYENLNLYIGKYKLNKYNISQLESLYIKLYNEYKMKVDWEDIIKMLENKEFDKYEKVIKSYFDLMVSQKFMPNTPTIANSGRRLSQLSACFTLEMNDNITSIMDAAKYMALIFQSGGGVGINYSSLREKGALISSTSGTSSGPVSFMGIINTITDVVKSGGVRRGANMSILNINSPDIREFIHAKETPHVLENFNVSVGIDKKFWECYRENKSYELISPHSNDVKGHINPRDILNEIAQSAWNSAEPGCIFLDNANKYHVMKELKGEIQVTNPCFHPDTLIETVEGRKRIKDITKPIMVYSCNQDGSLALKMASPSWKTRENTQTLKITMSNGNVLIVTPDHYLLNHELKWIKAQDLHIKDTLVSLCRARRGACYSGVKLSYEDNRAYRMEHRFIYENIHNITLSKYDDIHHKDGNTYNNNINNLELLSHDTHAQITAYTQPNDHQVTDKKTGRFITHENSRKGDKIITLMPEHLRSNIKGGFPRVIKIEEGPITDVYDIWVEDTHNLIANGIIAHNCGEQFIFPYESCNLGSINLAKFVKDGIVDWEALGKITQLCVEFLDSIIDINKYPINQIDNESWKTRRIGLGVMGVADLLYILNIPYNSKESYELQEQIAQFISYKAIEKSIEISKKRGSFPYYKYTECKNGRLDVSGIYEGSLTNILTLDWEKLLQDVKDIGIRNVYCLTVAPTGSISMIADCSSGIEPQFALVFEKKVAVGNFIYVNPYLEKYLKDNDIEFDDENKNIIAKTGSCSSTNLPDKVKNIFVTSMDIHYIDHVLVQAVWQRWIDNSIAKTVNMANNVTSTDILNLYLFAHEIGCKGTTVYRDGSRHTQVLYTENMENKELKASEYALNIYNEKMNHIKLEQQLDGNQILEDVTMEKLVKSHSKDVCPNCNGYTAKVEGCAKCIKCDVSFC